MGTVMMQHKPQSDRFVRFCDFCGATEQEAKTLIVSSNGTHICDECVKVCVDVLASKS